MIVGLLDYDDFQYSGGSVGLRWFRHLGLDVDIMMGS